MTLDKQGSRDGLGQYKYRSRSTSPLLLYSCILEQSTTGIPVFLYDKKQTAQLIFDTLLYVSELNIGVPLLSNCLALVLTSSGILDFSLFHLLLLL